ncbi:MAG: macrolide ABC transporter ATP-binding protein [Clostridiales bacterium GWE2_32_10]|nr:MAG: macrolide ABC transporter ATP-binding protein [Clostridiales bacterium GWE2_32_10]HBY19748.1 macrolide ABC transporter ATP-binding protein [Clostridiales bacterium]
MTADLVIEMNDVVKTYKMGNESVDVLKGVSINIGQGEFVCILGPSGSGKSTLMNIIGCIDTLSSGDYYLDGENITTSDEDNLTEIRNKKIGFIFQKFNLLPRYDALYNVALPLLTRGKHFKDVVDDAKRALAVVGLEDRMKHKPNELSGGQQQRVAIARALVGEPELLLADEPTGNLDSKSGADVINLFKELHKKGHTIVLITHDLNVAKNASRIILIQDGLISEEGVFPNAESCV